MDNKTTEVKKTMRTTIDKYNKLKDMDLINRAKYSLNDRVEMIIQEV